MEDVALHVLKNNIAHSNSPKVQLKTGDREVINLIPITYDTDIPLPSNLNIRSSRQSLSKVLKIPKKIPLNS